MDAINDYFMETVKEPGAAAAGQEVQRRGGVSDKNLGRNDDALESKEEMRGKEHTQKKGSATAKVESSERRRKMNKTKSLNIRRLSITFCVAKRHEHDTKKWLSKRAA